MMRFTLAVLALVAGLGSAQADTTRFCAEMWFARNAMYDKAGYCFGSALGRAIFDNTGCTGQDVRLSPAQQAVVDYANTHEKDLGCAVDTGRTDLPIAGIAARLRLVHIAPMRAFSPGSCLGYRGPDRILTIGPAASYAGVAPIQAGMDIHFDYETLALPEGWEMVRVTKGSQLVGYGWVKDAIRGPVDCREMLP